jgi:rubredoxin
MNTQSTEYFVCPKCSTHQPTEDCRDFSESPDPDQKEWFEWVDLLFSEPLDCENCGHVFERNKLEIKEDPSWHSIVERFKDEVLPMVRKIYERPLGEYDRDGRIDTVARSEAWNNWTDSLCKEGVISAHAYENWDQPPECR